MKNEYCPIETCKYHGDCFPYKNIKDKKDDDYFYYPKNKNEAETIIIDGHTWEVGYFGCEDNGYSAYGFRQDGLLIRITSAYEAEIFLKGLQSLANQ